MYTPHIQVLLENKEFRIVLFLVAKVRYGSEVSWVWVSFEILWVSFEMLWVSWVSFEMLWVSLLWVSFEMWWVSFEMTGSLFMQRTASLYNDSL